MKLATGLLFTVVAATCCSELVRADANGGTTCAGCTILVGLAEQLAQVHATNVVTAVENNLCVYLPSPFNTACRSLLNIYGDSVIDGLYHHDTPDIICHTLKFCTQDPGKEFCHLFPLPKKSAKLRFNNRKVAQSHQQNLFQAMNKASRDDSPICSLPGVKEICEIIDRFTDDHLPLQDGDRDKFSIRPTLRGTNWRGKDCNDANKSIYPGRKPINHDISYDSNCNGIYGVDPGSGMPFEDMLCSGTGQYGIAVLGDSASAHFHIPPRYLMAEGFSEEVFKDVLTVLTNEFDWPMLSAVTAYGPNKWPYTIHGPVDSLYLRLLKYNKCMHRDYQNIAVNGADSGNMHNDMLGLSRNKTTDNPLIVVLSLIGNDVCNGHPDTIAHMTTAEMYRSNMITTLNYLNSILPKGSTVILSGLADGRILWDTMSQRIHPAGQLNSDIRYKDLYAYLNCLEVSPCRGWMNSNETIRNLTSERAEQLSAQAKNLTETMKYQQFNLVYTRYDIKDMMAEWQARGGQDWEVIEPVDGFHPGQIGQALGAEYIYQLLTSKYPSVLGKINPHNDNITTLFGDQGGY